MRICWKPIDEIQSRRRAPAIQHPQLHVLAKGDAELEDLPDAGPEADDFLPAFKRGIGIGGLAGLFLGVAAMVFRSTSFFGGGGVLLAGLAGARLGGLLTGMAGASFPNSRLRIFEQEIAAGKILVMVDVPKDRIAHVNDLIRSVYPEVDVRGVEPRAPLIPW